MKFDSMEKENSSELNMDFTSDDVKNDEPDNQLSIIMFCSNRESACPKPITIGEIQGKNLKACPKIIKRLDEGNSVTLKLSNTKSLNKKILSDKTIDDFSHCVDIILEILEKKGKKKSVEELKHKALIKIRNLETSKSKLGREVLKRKRVGDWLYRKQKSQRGNSEGYWYLLKMIPGQKKETFYLGKNQPTFKPEIDLEILEQSKAQKKA
jgi:hypothetical protein